MVLLWLFIITETFLFLCFCFLFNLFGKKKSGFVKMIHLSFLFKPKPERSYKALCGRTDRCHGMPFVLGDWQFPPAHLLWGVFVLVRLYLRFAYTWQEKWQRGKLILLLAKAGNIGDAAVLNFFPSPVWQTQIQDGFPWANKTALVSGLTSCFLPERQWLFPKAPKMVELHRLVSWDVVCWVVERIWILSSLHVFTSHGCQ